MHLWLEENLVCSLPQAIWAQKVEERDLGRRDQIWTFFFAYMFGRKFQCNMVVAASWKGIWPELIKERWLQLHEGNWQKTSGWGVGSPSGSLHYYGFHRTNQKLHPSPHRAALLEFFLVYQRFSCNLTRYEKHIYFGTIGTFTPQILHREAFIESH